MTVMAAQSALPGRVALLSMHTSPLDQPGTGDAGGMNVYVVEVAKRLAAVGVEVDIFTRATSSQVPVQVELDRGVVVRSVPAGPYEGLRKEDLPGELCTFTNEVLRAEAIRAAGWYDVVHSHYWLSGQVGRSVAGRWGVPLIHTMHTMARVKNLDISADDVPEPAIRIDGEQEVVRAATRLIANTDDEARQLIRLYSADPDRVSVVHPGVDLDHFRPGSPAAARELLGLPSDAVVLLFVGRIQPLKAPDVLVRATALLPAHVRERVQVVICGGESGNGAGQPAALASLAADLGLADRVRFVPPVGHDELVHWYQAADLTIVPSYSESFGLVAVESQACGTPVVAAEVGGLPTAVADGRSGLLVAGHDPADWGKVITRALQQRAELARGARGHASSFSWSATAARTLDVYRAAIAESAMSDRLLAAGS